MATIDSRTPVLPATAERLGTLEIQRAHAELGALCEQISQFVAASPHRGAYLREAVTRAVVEGIARRLRCLGVAR